MSTQSCVVTFLQYLEFFATCVSIVGTHGRGAIYGSARTRRTLCVPHESVSLVVKRVLCLTTIFNEFVFLAVGKISILEVIVDFFTL